MTVDQMIAFVEQGADAETLVEAAVIVRDDVVDTPLGPGTVRSEIVPCPKGVSLEPGFSVALMSGRSEIFCAGEISVRRV